MIKILGLLYGKVKISVTYKHTETVINILMLNMPVLKLKKVSDNTISFYVFFKDKNKAIEYIKGINAEYKIEKEWGIPILVNRYKKRVGLILGIIIFSCIVYVSSHLIWEIRIEGNDRVSDNRIKDLLSAFGVAEGKIKNNDILEKVYSKVLISEENISWISVNFEGTIAHVEINEVLKIPERHKNGKNINIVAACDGVVKRIDAIDGKAEVLPGSVVTKGELLISSFVDSRKNGEIMRNARGSVWATTMHKYEISVPKVRYEKSYTGSSHTRKYIKILDKIFPLSTGYNNNKTSCEMSVQEEQMQLFNSIKLPFYIITEKKNDYNVTKTDTSRDDAKKFSDAELSKIMEKDLQKAEIIERNLYVSEDNENFIFNYEIICIENIATEMEFIIDTDSLQ